jgi:hypothetical protein
MNHHLDPLTLRWNLRFNQLAEYKWAHGHCNVPKKYGPNLELGGWVGRQREAKHQNKLIAEREAKLNAVGFVWKLRCMTNSTKCRKVSSPTDWDTRFEQVVKYKKANGDCNVSTKDSQNIELGRWVAAQRQAKKATQLSGERQAKLDSIGFVWNIRKCRPRPFSVQQVDWNVRFGQLLAYKLAVGDCDVPQNFRPNQPLGRWVQTQRLANKNHTLTNERCEKLNSIGFDWGKFRPKAGKNTSNRQHGLCDPVPERCMGDNPPHLHKLATEHHFNSRQKEVQEKESVAELKTADNENWDAHFREILAYLQTHGDSNAHQCYPFNPLLATWVNDQRNGYELKRRGEQTSLTPLREAKLDAIGFSWFVGGGSKDFPAEEVVSNTVRPEEARSGNRVVRSEQIGVASPDRITSG